MTEQVIIEKASIRVNTLNVVSILLEELKSLNIELQSKLNSEQFELILQRKLEIEEVLQL